MVAGDVDARGRRSRTTPISTGKHITPQETDLAWFAKLAEHGPLPSSFLLAYTKRARKSEKRATERLTDLFHEAETKHGGPYLTRPPQQFRTIDSRYNQLVYDLTPAGMRALVAAKGDAAPRRKRTGPWLHTLMVACVTASIELATLERDDLSYIPEARILDRAETELRHPVTIRSPDGSGTITKDLIPDALFGLEYHTPEGSRFRFFAVECDRATEPATTSNFNRKSWLRSLRQYQAYVAGGLYRDHLRLTAPLLVLNVTTDERRLASMIRVTAKEAGAPAYVLFQTWSDFGPVFRPPLPFIGLLSDPWDRAGRNSLPIDLPCVSSIE